MDDLPGRYHRLELIDALRKTWARTAVPLLTLLLVLGWAAHASATDHTGTCSGTFLAAANPHRLTGTCTVPAGQTLTLEAGVTLDGQNNTLSVNGTLTAVGTAPQPIVFNGVFVNFAGGSGGQITNDVLTAPTTSFSGIINITDASPTISGNTLTDARNSARLITVNGSSVLTPAAPTITDNQLQVPTFGLGIVYSDGTAGGTVQGNMITFPLAANGGRTAIQINGSASPRVEANTIGDDAGRDDTGIAVLVSATSTVQVVSNTICSTGGDTPIALALGFFADTMLAQVTGTTLSCGLAAGIALSGTATVATTLKAVEGQTHLHLGGAVTVNSGAQLTIPTGLTLDALGQTTNVNGTLTLAPGVILNGQNGTLSVSGTLSAVGTALQPIMFNGVFVNFAGGSGGQVTNDVLMAPTTSFSGIINITDASPTISGNTLTDARNSARLITVNGSSVLAPAAPTITGNQLQVPSFGLGIVYTTGTARGTVQGNTIVFVPAANGGRTGIQINGDASPQIEANTIGDDAGRDDTGIAVLVSATSTARVVNNTICSTGGDTPISVALGFFADTMLAQVSGTTLSCGLAAGIALSGTATVATTLKAVEGQTHLHLGGALTVNSQLTIPTGLTLDILGQNINANGTLTLAPGVILNGQNGTLAVSGTLSAVGTALQPIMFNGVFVNFAGGSGGQITNDVLMAPTTSFSGIINITDASPTISANTLTDARSSARLITVNGSSVLVPAAPTITGNQLQVPSFGFGIVYTTGTARGTVQGNTIAFVPAANGGRTGIQINGDASPRIEANTIGDDAGRNDTGIAVLVSASSTAQVVNNTICSTGGDTPLSFALPFFGDAMLVQVTGNILNCGVAAGFGISGTLAANGTLISIAGQTTYRLTSALTVGAGARLAIPPGFSIQGQGNALGVDGTLMATNVVFSEIPFIFRAGSSGSTLADSTIIGASGSFGTSITITNASPTITGNDVSGVATGISIADGSPSLSANSFTGLTTAITLNGATNASIDGNTFTGNGTVIRVNGTSALSTVANNTFDANMSSLAFANFGVLFSAFPQMFETNQFTGAVDQNVIPLPSSVLNVSGTLPGAPVAYQTSGLSIPAGTVVVLAPGTVIRASNGAAVTVNGQLVSAGTPDKPIRFTTTSPKTGLRWGGLTFTNQSLLTPSVLDTCIIEFAGSATVAALRLDNASMDIFNCRISDNNGVGIELVNSSNATIADSSIVMNLGDGIRANTGSRPSINSNSIFGNGGNGVNKQDCPVASNLIDAQDNFWGDDSGPRDASDDRAAGGLFNLGNGDEVSNCVDFDPWIRLGPSIAGTITGISGGGQSAPVNTCLPAPLVVEIDSTLGMPLQGIDVIFSVVSGDASIVENQPVQTGVDGRAQATVCLGATPGVIVIAVTARDVNSPFATFMPTAEPGGPCLFLTTALAAPDQTCSGDCNSDGSVTVNELLSGIGIALGNAPMSDCPSVDGDGDGEVTIRDLLLAVNRALAGCPLEGRP